MAVVVVLELHARRFTSTGETLSTVVLATCLTHTEFAVILLLRNKLVLANLVLINNQFISYWRSLRKSPLRHLTCHSPTK